MASSMELTAGISEGVGRLLGNFTASTAYAGEIGGRPVKEKTA
jgi:hypothetical protein